jgi:hypothetical protein
MLTCAGVQLTADSCGRGQGGLEEQLRAVSQQQHTKTSAGNRRLAEVADSPEGCCCHCQQAQWFESADKTPVAAVQPGQGGSCVWQQG